jgi:hypothetical protein
MTIQEITSIIATVIASISLIISIGAVYIYKRNLIATEQKFDFEIKKWKLEIKATKEQQRLNFLRDLFNGFTSHNWRFINHWEFPGIFPPLDDMLKAIPNKDEENRELFGKRVVALEHLNILMRVFTHKDVLEEEDIEGFTHWANNLYDGSKDALRTILGTGDTYPLDFIVWLKEVIYKEQDINEVIGNELRSRLRLYENQHRIDRK